ncbi:radical SAM protein [Mycolicibacterium fluoranthenivorans]|uniref:Radical SAM protein n=1 Tax=Mycolicibacterium fluoranthenivorans TaxID=258505 RepID=A0A7G8PDZ4_9MYCO|nr:radical SAM protein [Mycolicibacterium fluoranthenivorans]QNJ92560.1 radical SAM protein [Mycolicibacterium fluoranthenivorans]
MSQLTEVQRAKFGLLEKGLNISGNARLALEQALDGHDLSSHDFASTSGIILELDRSVWVNAPIYTYNPNFVDSTPYCLEFDNQFYLSNGDFACSASIWMPPSFHKQTEPNLRNYVVTHGDRARLSPIRSCAMKCDFCNIPFEDPIEQYRLKPLDSIRLALDAAVNDAVQPARHLLISGGTPKPKDVDWMRQLYYSILEMYPHIPVDIMMVPVPGLFNLSELAARGLNELSINIELFDQKYAKRWMPNKFHLGLDPYLALIEAASNELGIGRSRSMLMVGLEPMEATLAGVRAIAERGGTPVLSPFRPDPATPLHNFPTPTALAMERVYVSASEIVERYGVALGPACAPCSHNTISFAPEGQSSRYIHPRLRMIGTA